MERTFGRERIRIGLIATGFFLAVTLSYWAGIHQTQQGPGARQKTYTIELAPFGCAHVTVGQLGLAVIFMLTFLLVVAVALGLLAERRRRHVEALNADLERKVEARTRDLQAANKELEAFSLSVSHDLRAPLRAVDGFTAVLLKNYRDKLGEEGMEYLERVRGAVQRMAQLIEDLLSLSRVTRTEIRRDTVDLTANAREVVEELRRLDPERKVEVNIAEGLHAAGDSRLLRQVLENLLGNAWKYSSKRPAAQIEMAACEGRNGRQAFFVKDNGAGFDMRYANKLFKVFQRLHSNSDFPGSGVGLATVQRIIHRHGGEVWAEGSIGQGATFYFTL